MPRPKGSKSKKFGKSIVEEIKPLIKDFSKRKGWPKGKKRGPRKDLHQLHLDAHAMMLKNMHKASNDTKMDFKVLLISLAKTIIAYFKK